MKLVAEIAAAAINGMWQAAILAAIVWLSLRFARRIDAATRYVIWWILLAAVAALPLASRLLLRPKVAAPAPTASQATPSARTLQHFRRLDFPVPAPPNAAVRIVQRHASTWPQWLLVAWISAFAFRLIQIVRSYVFLRGIKRRSRIAAWRQTIRPRSAQLLLSEEILSPFAAGFLHPAVIIPTSLPDELNETQLSHVLLHEAAHLARRDDWMNLIGRLLGAALALHPVALWILARIDREREMACDDWAVARIGAPRPYCESLTRVCEVSRHPRYAALASGALGGRSPIRQRIETLLAKDRVFSAHLSISLVAGSALALVALITVAARSPRWIALAQRPEFEVASVKPNTTNGNYDATPRRSGDLIIMHNTRLGSMIYYAYHLRAGFQLVADQQPKQWWDWYDVDAKAPASATEDQIRLMFQSLLEDPFKLKVHRETRELPAYHLVVAKNGPKLKPPDEKGIDTAVDGRPFHMQTGRCASLAGMDGSHLVCAGATVAQMLPDLMSELKGPVVDETGLTGSYNYLLTYQRPDGRIFPDVEAAPPLMEAIQADLGLRLEKGKAPVEVLVVDHVEKPTGN